MPSKKLRIVLADAIVDYVNGDSTSRELEQALVFDHKSDATAHEISFAVDLFIDDFKTHKNEGRYRLNKTTSATFRRWSSFLRSERNLQSKKQCEPKGFFSQLVGSFLPDTHECFNNEFWPLDSPEAWLDLEKEINC